MCSLPTFGFVQEEGGETFSTREQHGGRAPSEKFEYYGGEKWEQQGWDKGSEDEQRQEAVRGGRRGRGEGKEWAEEQKQGGGGAVGGGIIRAIGETLVEIGQTTKDLVAGQHPLDVLRGGKDEKERGDEEAFKGM